MINTENIGYYISETKWIGTDYDTDLKAFRRLIAVRDSIGEEVFNTILDHIDKGVFISDDSNLRILQAKSGLDKTDVLSILWKLIRYKIFHNKVDKKWFLNKVYTIVIMK